MSYISVYFWRRQAPRLHQDPLSSSTLRRRRRPRRDTSAPAAPPAARRRGRSSRRTSRRGGALDEVAVQLALVERAAVVRADVIDGVEAAVDVAQRDALAVDLVHADRAWRRIVRALAMAVRFGMRLPSLLTSRRLWRREHLIERERPRATARLREHGVQHALAERRVRDAVDDVRRRSLRRACCSATSVAGCRATPGRTAPSPRRGRPSRRGCTSRRRSASISRIGIGAALACSLSSRLRDVWFASLPPAVGLMRVMPYQTSEALSVSADLNCRSLIVCVADVCSCSVL